MPHSLREIVTSALRQADDQVKVASLRDAPIQDRGFARVDQYLAEALGQVEVAETTKQASAAAPTPTYGGLDDANFALKLAEALEHGGALVEKLAGPLNKSDGGAPHSGPAGAGGLVAKLPIPLPNAKTVSPTPQASSTA